MEEHITPEDIDYLKESADTWYKNQSAVQKLFYNRDQKRMLNDLFAFLRKIFEKEEVI